MESINDQEEKRVSVTSLQNIVVEANLRVYHSTVVEIRNNSVNSKSESLEPIVQQTGLWRIHSKCGSYIYHVSIIDYL